MSTGVVLIAHGSRDPKWRAPFDTVVANCAASIGADAVRLAFMELTGPTLADAVAGLVAAGHTRIRVLPLFMSAGGHVAKDIPKQIDAERQTHPGVTFEQLAPVGQHQVFYDLVQRLATDACE